MENTNSRRQGLSEKQARNSNQKLSEWRSRKPTTLSNRKKRFDNKRSKRKQYRTREEKKPYKANIGEFYDN